MRVNKPLNIKIGFYFLITNLILVFILSSFFYFFYSNILIKKELYAKKEAIEKSGNYIELYINKLTSISEIISQDKSIYYFLKNNKNDEKNRILDTISNIMSVDSFIKSIILIAKDGRIISNEKNIDMKISSNMMKENWYVKSLMNTMPVLNPLRKQNFFNNEIDNWVIAVSKEIQDTNGDNLGVLLIDVKYQALHEYFKKQDLDKNSDIIIIDNNNQIVYCKNAPCNINKHRYIDRKEGYNHKDNLNVIKYPIKNTNWTLIEVSSLTEIIKLKRYCFQLILLSGIISLLITIFINFKILKKITNPIKELENHMNLFANNLSKIKLKGDISIEILSLQNHFNEMIDKIKYLREYEINALYSQINPHFLYNTLDTIIWMAEFKDTEKVISITKALANFFRLSLNNGKEKITLKEEVKHIEEYLYIQKQRYEEKLQYSIHIHSELESLEVPKIILQPFVENAIYHGIKNLDTTGFISIYTKIIKNEHKLEIIIEDNGVGFKASKNKTLAKMGGIGINNVNKRIHFYYGNNYGIKIDKSFKNGARIIISLPLN